MMTHDQNPDNIVRDAEEKMVGKALEIQSAQIALANGVSLGMRCRFCECTPEFRFELIRKLG